MNSQKKLFRYDAEASGVDLKQKTSPWRQELWWNISTIKQLPQPIDRLEKWLQSLQQLIETLFSQDFWTQAKDAINKDILNIFDTIKESETLILNKLKMQWLQEAKTIQLENYKEDIVHAIKSPLNHIKWFINLRKIDKNTTYLELMEPSIYKALDFLNIDIKPQRQNLKTKTQEMWQQLIGENEKDLKFNNLIPQDLQITIGKSILQWPILDSLLSNAIKFTPDHGTITISANKTDEKRITLTLHDTGKGIPKDKIDQIFSWYTSKSDNDPDNPHGTGIGLQQTSRVIHELWWTIKVKSTEGKGTTFTLSLPIVSTT